MILQTIRPETAAAQAIAEARQNCKDEQKRTYFMVAAIAVVVYWAYKYFKPETDTMKYVRSATIFGGIAYLAWATFFKTGDTIKDIVTRNCDTLRPDSVLFPEETGDPIKQEDNGPVKILTRFFAAN
jgi:hypothetical protein